MSDEYVDIQAGMRLLGETQHKFFYHVDRREIAIEPGSGRKRRRYKVSDILAVRERLKTKKRKPVPVLIDWVGALDVPVALKLSQQVYSEEVDLREAALYQSWRKNNQHITIGAFSPDRSEVYATIQLVPLGESIILDVLAGRREESSIMPDEIRAYDEPGPYSLLAVSVTALKSRPLLLYALLSRYIDFWIGMYPERYISKVYAQAVSESGMMLAQHMFMSPRRDLAFNAFELDLAYPPASKLIRQFKAQLVEKAPLPPALQWPPETRQEAQEMPATRKDNTQHIKRERPPTTVSAPPTHGTAQPEGTLTLSELSARVGRSEKTLLGHLKKWDKAPEEYPMFEHIRIPIEARAGMSHRYFTDEQAERIAAWIEANTKKAQPSLFDD